MPVNYDIVVSAENNYYSMWQAMLLHHSCLRHLGRVPIVVVHGDGQELLSGFQLIQQKGGRIQRARNFRYDDGLDYAPRNTAGTLSCVRSDADYLVICDTDMLFLRPLPMEQHALAEDQISFDAVFYLTLDDATTPTLAQACRRAGVPMQNLRQSPISGGVPHIVPANLRIPISQEWLQCMQFFAPPFPSTCQTGPHVPWLSTMWALVLTVYRLRLRPILTRFCITNHGGRRPLTAACSKDAVMLHYCYGDAEFDKRKFVNATHALHSVWKLTATGRSVNEAICNQLRDAATYYGLARCRGKPRTVDVVPSTGHWRCGTEKGQRSIPYRNETGPERSGLS